MKIGLIDVDGHNFPNFALMKISAWHKQNGDSVEWYDPLFCKVDRIYASKVFTFTEPYPYFQNDCEIVKGGTGYDFTVRLPEEIEKIAPDYSIYPQYGFALGFLSRGCIRNCPWCIVPKKEGKIRPVDDIERIHRESGRRHIVLMDNNFLACEVEETLHRIMEIQNFDRGVSPFVMPWRDLDGDGQIKDDNLKRLANWCNKAAVRASCRFENFKG